MGESRPSRPEERLLRIAGSVSDREPVEWAKELDGAPELAAALDQLRNLAALAHVHETSLGGIAPPAPAAGSEVPDLAAAGAEPDLPARGRTWGPLHVLEAVGRGGFGHVYRAFDPGLEREVALKLWRRRGPDDAARHLAEARALARLRHPSLPVVHGVGEHDGWLGMWTELVRGRTLEELLAAHGPLGAREAARVGIEVCRALSAAHAEQLVHRDVKTSNVMREEGGRVVLLDFGLAVRTTAAAGERAAGTPSSMAPEVLRGERATPRSDIYGVGVLLYRLVTRAFPHDTTSEESLLERHQRGTAVPLLERRADLPLEFVRTVERAMAPDPDARHPDAGALEAALVDFVTAPMPGDTASPAPTGVRARTAGPVRSLPRLLTRFVGRDQEVWECLEAIRASRMVTLAGPAGCGKTRLAIRAAQAIADTAERAVVFVDLAPLTEPATIASEILRTLDAPPALDGDSRSRLDRALAASPLLLVLDNCEHLHHAMASLAADLLAAHPALTILATGRAALRIPGERTLTVPPLALPPEEGPPRAAVAATFDAVRLFVDRAKLVRADFQLTDENAGAVAEVCRRADGLPLAIELAAARARVLTPEEIRDRLSRDLALLGHGGFSTQVRHRTLETAIRSTYDTLPARERSLVDALAVFSGSWTLEAATRVCIEGADELEALDRITSLIENSLVSAAPPRSGVSRYRFLETLHRFAFDRLEESGRLADLQRRHFTFFLEMAESAEPGMWGPGQAGWAARLDADHSNFLAALAWARTQPDRAGDHLRLAGALARFWTERGHLVTGREALKWAIEHNPPDRDPPASARAWLGEGTLAAYQSDHAAARTSCARALEIYRRLDDASGVARALVVLGVVAMDVADYEAARATYQESLDLYRARGETRGVANVLNNLGAIAWRQGEWEEAGRLHDEALIHAWTAKDPGIRALSLTNLGFVALHQDRLADAVSRSREALALVREHRLLRHAASCLEVSAAILARHRESARAARLYAAAREHRSRLGGREEPAWRRAHEPMQAAITRDLGSARFEEESRAGSALDLEKAIDDALRGLGLVEPGTG